MTNEQYKDYATREKGPLFDSLPSVKKFELVRIEGAVMGEIPYEYVAVVHVNSLDELNQKGKTTQKFQDFLKEWMPMVKNVHILYGEDIY